MTNDNTSATSGKPIGGLSENISKFALNCMFDDIIKFNAIILITHLLFYSVDDVGVLLDSFILKLMLYVTISLIFFHLFVKKILKLKNAN